MSNLLSMMLKLPLYFTLSFLILSISINERPLFQYMAANFRPYSHKVLVSFDRFSRRVYVRGKNMVRQLFSNSVPVQLTRETTLEDSSLKIERELPLVSAFNKKKYLSFESNERREVAQEETLMNEEEARDQAHENEENEGEKAASPTADEKGSIEFSEDTRHSIR